MFLSEITLVIYDRTLAYALHYHTGLETTGKGSRIYQLVKKWGNVLFNIQMALSLIKKKETKNI